MKIIFLDIDGVLNSFEKHVDLSIPHHKWCPESMNALGIELEIFDEYVERLNKITDTTGAKLVLSSSWRIGYLADYSDVIVHLHNVGVKAFIVGRTPWGNKLKTRGQEIKAWFDKYPNEKIESFVILDDSDKLEPFVNHLVRTNHKKGLQDKDVKKAIKKLGKIK